MQTIRQCVDSRYLVCRNCGERTLHDHIGSKLVSVPSFRLFGRQFYREIKEPVYACKICRCERCGNSGYFIGENAGRTVIWDT